MAVNINLDNATLVGESNWVKDSCTRVYEYEGKFYSVIVYNQMNLEILEDSIIEIKKEDVHLYMLS